MRRSSLTIAAALAAATIAPARSATILTLYSTGVDASGAATTGHGADLHWTLDSGAAFTGAANNVFPIGPWVSETPTARWLTPSPNAADSYDPFVDGIYTYSETFSLAGYRAATAALSGSFASDNSVDKITLNGALITGSGGSLSALTAFNSTGGTFNAGLNTLTFTLRNDAQNGGNPTGLFVELSGLAATVPELATWVLMVAGFGLIGVTARRRTHSVAA